MTLFQAELKYYLRSPIIWLIVTLMAFISAWSFLLSIEIFTSLQVKFSGMSDAPTILQGIIYPVLAAQSKIIIVVVAIIAGLSFARLNNNHAWILLLGAQRSELKIVWQKYIAILLVSLIFIAPAILAIICLSVIVGLDFLPILVVILGLLLLLMWLLSVAMLLSSLVNNTGFAVLLVIVVFMVFWLMSQATLGQEWGKNWLQVLSPFYHFQQFMSNQLTYAAIFYFFSGIFLGLWATKLRLMHKRYSL
ncbi:MAG: hypothetical protein L3J53_03970 [Proteobacteria bacterium]|nr:hypothetical protein [Pseudomonadota bacterium]